jgi:hypothetical protein
MVFENNSGLLSTVNLNLNNSERMSHRNLRETKFNDERGKTSTALRLLSAWA